MGFAGLVTRVLHGPRLACRIKLHAAQTSQFTRPRVSSPGVDSHRKQPEKRIQSNFFYIMVKMRLLYIRIALNGTGFLVLLLVSPETVFAYK